MSWQLTVDSDVCMGSGMCVGAMPDHFRLDEEYAEPVAGTVEPSEDLLDVADSCPAMAIQVLDESGTEVGPRP